MKETLYGDLSVIGMRGCEKFAEQVDGYLKEWRRHGGEDTYLAHAVCSRFGSGEGKATIQESMRGQDVYIFCDMFNHSITYKMFGQDQRMSPDDHYADLKRIIAAIGGKARRITVIMPMLYEGRQHKRAARESLDCAIMLQELVNMGVTNILTFDAHDPRVANAIPLSGFDNVTPSYQMLKAMVRSMPDVVFDKDHIVMISPDEGAMGRCMYYSETLGVDIGMFYKRRDYTRVVNGRNPIVAHEYLGESVEGKDVFIADDIIASGESMLDIGYELKMRGAKNIFTCATFPLFTAGLDKFDKAYNDGIIKAVLGTNLTYRKPELLERPWYFDVDLSKYTAYFIAAINHDMSVSSIIDPMTKIKHLLDNHGIPIGNQE